MFLPCNRKQQYNCLALKQKAVTVVCLEQTKLLTYYLKVSSYPGYTWRWRNVDLLLFQRRRRWTNIKPTLCKRLVFAGIGLAVFASPGQISYCPRLPLPGRDVTWHAGAHGFDPAPAINNNIFIKPAAACLGMLHNRRRSWFYEILNHHCDWLVKDVTHLQSESLIRSRS